MQGLRSDIKRCGIAGCTIKSYARSMCEKHYRREYRDTGKLHVVEPRFVPGPHPALEDYEKYLWGELDI